MQRNRNASRRHVPVALNVGKATLPRELQLVHEGVDDPDVSLVGDDTGDVFQLNSGLFHRAAGRVRHGSYGLLKNFFSGHDDTVRIDGCGGRDGLAPGHGISQVEKFSGRTIGSPVESQNAFSPGFVSHHHGPGAVPKKDAGVAVPPVHHGGKALGADEQNVFGGAGFQELIGDNQAVKKTGAGGLKIESRAAGGTDLGGDPAGGGGEHGVRRDGGGEDEVEFFCRDFGVGQGLPSRGHAHEGGGFLLRGDPALLDAGAGQDPLVAGVDEFFELVIRKGAGGKINARPGHPQAGIRLRWHRLWTPCGLLRSRQRG